MRVGSRTALVLDVMAFFSRRGEYGDVWYVNKPPGRPRARPSVRFVAARSHHGLAEGPHPTYTVCNHSNARRSTDPAEAFNRIYSDRHHARGVFPRRRGHPRPGVLPGGAA